MTFKVVQFGCGPIGCSVTRLAAKKSNFEIVGAVDLANAGKDLGEVAGIDRKLGVIISDDADAVLSKTRPDAVFHTTGSSLEKVFLPDCSFPAWGLNCNTTMSPRAGT